MDRANVTQIIIKNSKKKKSKNPQNSDNTYKMEQNSDCICVFLSPFLKPLTYSNKTAWLSTSCDISSSDLLKLKEA